MVTKVNLKFFKTAEAPMPRPRKKLEGNDYIYLFS